MDSSTNPIIVPIPSGMWALRYGQGELGQFKTFREALIGLRSFISPEEFERRFPETASKLRREVTDQVHSKPIS